MKGLQQDVEAIVRDLGLDEAEIAARTRFLELDDADRALLREVHALIARDSAAFADSFYTHLFQFAELRALVPDAGTEARLHRALSAYFAGLPLGRHDHAYVLDRLRVGAAHERIGLEPKWYIGAYRKYLAELIEILGRQLRDDPDKRVAAVNAVLKVVCLDMGLTLDTYFHASQRRLRQNSDYLEQVIDGMPAGLIVLDHRCRVRSMNRMMADMLGVPDDALSGLPPLGALLACPELGRRVAAALATGQPQDGVMAAIDGREDGVRYFEFNIRRTRQQDGDLLLLIGQDATFRRRARLKLQESEEYFRLTFSQAAVGIAHLARDGRLLRVNGKLSQILGCSEAELVHKFCAEITHPDDVAEDQALTARLAAGEIAEFTREKRLLRRDGSVVWVTKSMSALHDAAGNLRFIAVIEDISRRKQAEEALLRMASHDALTGLPNRVLLQDRLAHAIAHAQRNGQHVGVMFIDLDRFKHVNDSLGHDAGDQLIVQIAQRLAGCLRESDTVARQGGDEFVLVLPALAGAADAAQVARKVLGSLFQPLEVGGQELFPSGSIGIALYPGDGEDSQTLLKCADSAMYHAKAAGGNRFAFYAADMGMLSFEHLQLEGALQRALRDEEFELYYQPIIALGAARPVAVEALLRWHSRRQGMVMPGEFIPLAEETGLIVQIGEWVLRRALRQLAAWRAAGMAPLRVFVNLSARQFHGADLAELVARLAHEAGADPAWLGLEITESVLMENPGAAADTLRKLAAMGVQLAIDDFGTGYSSLASLRRFPLHSLKIDRSFVSDIGHEEGGAEIVKAVIALAHSLNLQVVAEGVEREAQLDFLRHHGCDLVQGFAYSGARPVDDLEQWLAAAAPPPQP